MKFTKMEVQKEIAEITNMIANSDAEIPSFWDSLKFPLMWTLIMTFIVTLPTINGGMDNYLKAWILSIFVIGFLMIFPMSTYIAGYVPLPNNVKEMKLIKYLHKKFICYLIAWQIFPALIGLFIFFIGNSIPVTFDSNLEFYGCYLIILVFIPMFVVFGVMQFDLSRYGIAAIGSVLKAGQQLKNSVSIQKKGA
jgi:hypothetical protein